MIKKNHFSLQLLKKFTFFVATLGGSVNATVELAHLGSINYTSSSISTDLPRLKSTSDG
jgi:hypothetical protein